ncbi:hypothetical protein Ddye_006250 [Dipteronia dyeriana]|uniref:Reverse transcriptase zinc-binding domain-containing protein n=1 Tax=Dipteronia dyeriana TaxID=168575 RepID=A0AAD9XI92_9ROSI|nr:hypothetical protein Ddye_006250 [Dipteronia dyeriana]
MGECLWVEKGSFQIFVGCVPTFGVVALIQLGNSIGFMVHDCEGDESRTADSLMWHFEKLDIYSVWSGYKVAKNLISNSSSSHLSELWRLKILPKIKLFIWKIRNHWIPTLKNIVKHGMSAEVFYPICARKPELTMHASWVCSDIKTLRSSCYFL